MPNGSLDLTVLTGDITLLRFSFPEDVHPREVEIIQSDIRKALEPGTPRLRYPILVETAYIHPEYLAYLREEREESCRCGAYPPSARFPKPAAEVVSGEAETLDFEQWLRDLHAQHPIWIIAPDGTVLPESEALRRLISQGRIAE